MGVNELDCVITDLCRQIREGKDEIIHLREENARLREELQKGFTAMRVFAKYRELEAEIETLRKTLIGVLAGFVASVDLLERGGKKAAPSDKMFAQTLVDYKNRIERGRAAVAAIREGGKDG